MPLTIALAQFNPLLGDLLGNQARIVEFAERASAQGADLLLTPELSLCGYPPEDLLLRSDFYVACAQALAALASTLAARTPELAVLVGHPRMHDELRYNAASLLVRGEIIHVYHKQRLPSYEVFDEARYFAAGEEACVFTLKGVRCAVNICADIWQAGTAEQAQAAGAELLLVLNASPYHRGKRAQRLDRARERIASTGLAVFYANLVGGQDELVFDGASFVLNRDGELCCQCPSFAEALVLVRFAEGQCSLMPQPHEPKHPEKQLLACTDVSEGAEEAELYQALVLGVRDYLAKNTFRSALIGLSGGIDSALTLCIAVDALGAEQVHALMLPSPYTAQMSLDDARAMAAGLGVRYDEIPIDNAMHTFADLLQPIFNQSASKAAQGTTAENLQARIRGTLLMALSNQDGALVLTTGNKSEMAVGYCTLYGDMAGGFAVLKDVSKTWVYRLANWRNAVARSGTEPALLAGTRASMPNSSERANALTIAPIRAPIPARIIDRPPSAELRPNQTDQDSLPDYAVLDAIMEAYVERKESLSELLAQGYDVEEVKRVIHLIHLNEYKRRQAPVGIRTTARGFGRDWRYPITQRYTQKQR
ncbi:MAG: NAD+ synthase [Pseudomonadota bacterium]